MSRFVHSRALVESNAVGDGTRVWAFAHIMDGAVVGADCNICGHAFIEAGATLGDRVTVKNNALIWHGVHIADDVFVGPNVVFTNDPNPRVRFKKDSSNWLETHVHEGVSIGANATIVCGLTLREHAMVGAGSVVTKDVVSHSLVYGNPAVHRRWVCECGSSLGVDLVCPICSRSYRSLDGGGLEPA